MKALALFGLFYWPRIDHDIEELCRNCAECLSYTSPAQESLKNIFGSTQLTLGNAYMSTSLQDPLWGISSSL
ncbi:Hypothetical protein NTJ_11431 [Nesidiocoris tenuis]|uniref:Integrase zinc-binding domain-containing protein n=1 Tax=Nesidiocoris tenuis TaxID=355587 RepID=A0ABN7B2J0_9HEMI|nr:Hypothetical protein NTJ_11431 [Nesidiocoris tenuis]